MTPLILATLATPTVTIVAAAFAVDRRITRLEERLLAALELQRREHEAIDARLALLESRLPASR